MTDACFPSILFFMGDDAVTTQTDESVSTNTSEPDGGTVIIELEGLIKNHITSIDKVADALRKHKEMLDDIFNNNPTYKQHMEAVKEATRIKNNTRQEMMKQPQVAELSEKVKDMKGELKDLKGALSDYLREYQKMSGVNEIEGEDGQIREIIYEAKLIKKFYN